uniref:Uncharacterized protein n=1 Tax=Amphimedon queenslandica TaxID=400682 RepID=A0A1X7TLJ6_AMPQE
MKTYQSPSYFHGTALHYASETNNADMANLLLTKGKADVNALDKWNRTPLFNAVMSGSIEAVDILLTNGARTDIVDTYNRTPLFNAVQSGSIEAVKSLLKDGAKTDVVDEGGETLLHCAGTSGEVKMLRLLIKKGVTDVNALDKRNRTPLFNAVESGSIEAVKILLEKEAKTDVVNE